MLLTPHYYYKLTGLVSMSQIADLARITSNEAEFAFQHRNRTPVAITDALQTGAHQSQERRLTDDTAQN